jgi:hypothetical protein
MIKRLTLVAAVALAAPAIPGIAAQPIALHAQSAGELAELCGAAPGSPGADAKINFCNGFAQGVVDLDLKHAGEKKPFCVPTGTSRRSTMSEFVNWVRAAPAHRDLPATDGLLQFLGDRYPCK